MSAWRIPAPRSGGPSNERRVDGTRLFLKGINVGGHRPFRPSLLAKELKDANVLSVGGAGTFVVPDAVGRTAVRTAIARRLPFKAEVMVCGGREVLRLIDSGPFADQTARPDTVRFVSVMARRRRPPAPLPLTLPSRGRWFVKALSFHGRFVVGLYRREMRTIGYLGQLEQIVGTPLTARSWNTFLPIGKILRP